MTALPSGLVDITPGEESLRAQAKAFAAGRNPGPSSDSIAGDARSSAKSSMAPMERSYLDDYVSLGSNVLPKWYTDFGGTFLKSAESLATGVGQGVVDAVSAVSGGLVDLSNPGGRIDTTHAERLLASEDPAVREQGQRLMNQAKIVDQSAREGFRGDIERRRESSFGAVDPESVASTAGGIAGGIAPSVLAMIPGLQVPVLAGYFANSYEQNYDAYANAKMAETGTYDPAIASAVGTVMGGVEAAFEYLPIRGVKNAARAAEEALFSAAKRAAPGWRLEAAKAIAKIMGVGAVQEGVEEGGTELVGELVRLSYDRKLQERYHTDPVGTAAEAAGRILKAAGTGAIGGVLLGGAGALTMAGAAGESGLSEDLSEPVRTPDSPDNGDLHQSGGTVPREEGIGDRPIVGQSSKPSAFTADSVKKAFQLDDAQAQATVALADAMALDKSRIEVASGGGSEGDLAQENAGVWYSKLSEVVNQKMGGAMDADQLRAMLVNNGVKPEEMEWSGVGELSGKVTKQQMLEHLAENSVKVTEKVLDDGGGLRFVEDEHGVHWLNHQMPRDGQRARVIEEDEGTWTALWGKQDKNFPSLEEAKAFLLDALRNDRPQEAATKFSGYTTPGGEDYRELLLTLPDVNGDINDPINKRIREISRWPTRPEDALREEDQAELDSLNKTWESRDRGVFASSHFDEPNILAHVRFNERTDADGKRVLFIEEVQSDWAQGIRAGKNHPKMPFQKTWHELAMKRMIRYAAENGFDRVAWTTGDMQAERYDLSAQVDEMAWLSGTATDDAGKTVLISVKGGRPIQFKVRDGKIIAISESAESLEGKPLEDAVGKEIAQKIMSSDSGHLKGDGLKVGGEGMKGFYDKMLVTDTNKIIKRHGGKVGTTRFKQPDTFLEEENQTEPGEVFSAHSFDITPSMRQEALQKGMPLFQSKKGSISFPEGGKAIIRGLTNPDVSTGIHEIWHVARRFLLNRSVTADQRAGITDDHIAKAEEFAGAKDGVWSVEAEEKFARAGERYLRDGKAPNASLQSLFDSFRSWLVSIYKHITGSAIDIQITDEMRKVFDALVQRGSPRSSDSPSLMKVAFGMANLEVGKEGRQSQRVGRPEAIRALRASGLLPTTTDPRDFAHEVISDPEKYAEFLDELRKSPELSRGQSEALFGEQEKMKKEEQRHQWVDAVLDLAASNAVDVGPNPPVAVPLPPGNEGIKAKQPEPPDERIAIRNDLIARFSESMVDQLMKLDDLVKRSEAALGRKLTEAENPILQLRLDKSHRAIEQQDFQRETLIPMLRRMVEKGITDEDVGKLAVAMHAEEANQQIAIRNPDDPTRGAGMSNEYAAQVMDEMSAHPESATAYEAAALIQTILQSRTELDNAHGIVSDQSMASMTDVYRHYVAMIDDPSVHMEGDDVAGMENVPRNAYSVGMQQRLNRLGREYGSLDDPNSVRGKLLFKGVIAHTVELYERGILRRHQNDALNTLRRFATSTAVVQKGVTVRFEPPFVKSLDRSENVVKQEMEALSAYKKRADVLYAKLDEDVTIGEGDKAKTYPKGSPFFLEVADERLADTLKNAPRPDPSTRALYSAFRLASAVVRFGATSGVSANYAVSNVIRDLGMAMATIDSDPARFAKAKRDLVANMPKALKSLMAASVGKSGDSEMDTYLREFRDDGGIQEMFGKNDFDSAKSMVKHVLEPTAFTKLADAKDAMLAFATESTKPFENMTRLSYYVSLRKNGVDRRTAALRSRSLTVDFQVHGKNTGFMRAGWAFMNAGIQGTNKLQQMMRTPGGQAWAGVYFLSAVAETMAAYMYFGDTDEDKDGKPDWAAVTSWERDTKIRVPGVPVQLPVMWGMNVPKAMGHWIAEKMLGVSDDGRNAQAFANSVGDAFNPIGGADFFSGHGFFRTVLPDLLDPALDLYTNKDFLGRRIRNEPFSHDQEAAWVDSQHPMDGTPDVYSRIADAFNTISGGDEATSGLIDAAPETYRYLFMALAGGGARTVERLGKVITSGITGDPVAMSDVPIAGVVARSVPDSRAVNESYYDAVTDTQEFVGRMKAYENAGNDEAAWRMREEDPIRTDASIVITSAEKTLRAMREQLKELRKANAPHEDIKRITDAIMEEKAAALYTIRNGRR